MGEGEEGEEEEEEEEEEGEGEGEGEEEGALLEGVRGGVGRGRMNLSQQQPLVP